MVKRMEAEPPAAPVQKMEYPPYPHRRTGLPLEAVIAAERWRDECVKIAIAAAPVQQVPVRAMVKHMVDRFLGWKLPADFNPDAFISFDRMKALNSGYRPSGPYLWPSGTNLLDAGQAEAMVLHMLEGYTHPDADLRAELALVRARMGHEAEGHAKAMIRAVDAEAERDSLRALLQAIAVQHGHVFEHQLPEIRAALKGAK